MKTKTTTRQVVVLSDLHIGSTVGLWPAGFVANEGYEIGQNEFQKWLWKCWQDCQAWIAETTGGDPYYLLLNGDLVDGIHHRTLQVMSPDVGDQSEAVLQVLGPVAEKAERLYLVKGTECHTRNDEVRLGKVLGAVRDRSTGQRAFDRLEMSVAGCPIAAAHHIGTTSRPYLEAGQHSINLGVEIIEAVRAGKKPPKVIIRAHRHRHGIFTDGINMSVVTGAWQGITRFGRKVVPAAVPQPSAVVLDWRGRDKGELPDPHYKVWTQ